MALQFDPGAYFSAYKMGQDNINQGYDRQRKGLEDIAGGIGVLAENSYKKKALLAAQQKEREEKAIPLAKELGDNGLKPDEITNVVNNFIATGQLDIPSMRSKFVGNEPGIGPISSGTERISYGPKKDRKRLYYQKEPGGPFVQEDVPEGIDPIVKTLSFPQKPAQGEEYVDVVAPDFETGQIKKFGSVKKGSRVLATPKTPAEKENPELKAQRDLFKKTTATIEKLQADGEEVPDALIAQANELATAVGLEPQEQVTEPAGWFRSEKTRTIYKPKGTVAPPPAQYESAEAVRAALKAKKITKDIAIKILREKFGYK